MKKIFMSIACALMTMGAAAETVNVETAGTLQSLLGDDYLNVAELTVTGNLNGTDIRTIREMAGVNDHGLETGGILQTLDLSGANIVSGGDPYYYYYGSIPRNTKNNVVGMLMFKSTQLVNITLPESITEIEKFAFESCMQLETLTMPGTSLTTIGEGVCNFDTALRKVVLAESIRQIGSQMFEGCKALEECNIPSSLVQVGANMFADCVALKEIVIPEGVRGIGDMAFNNCLGLEEITIPSSVVALGQRSLFNCAALKAIYNYSDTPANIDDEDVFTYVNDETCILYVPDGSEQIYGASQGWNKFKNIRPLSQKPGEDTAVRGIATATRSASTAAYSLSGQSVNDSYKGIVIQNGKKFVKK